MLNFTFTVLYINFTGTESSPQDHLLYATDHVLYTIHEKERKHNQKERKRSGQQPKMITVLASEQEI